MQSFSEKFLYHIWDGFHFVNPLISESGKKIEVVFQGRWNTAAGPDFLNAILKFNGKTVTGDVEIHLDSYDWKKHSHDEDKNYNNVILHVVFTHNTDEQYTISESGNKIDIVKIGNFLDDNISKLLAEYKQVPFEPIEKTCNFFRGETIENIRKILAEYGLKRFENKVKRYNAELTFRSFDQVLYSALLESAGYSKNKFQMMKLSQMITYRKLKSFYKRGMTYDDFLAGVLVSSGLFDVLPSTFPNQFKQKWLDTYKVQKYFKDAYRIEWISFRIRPVNNPAIRFLQISKIIYNSLKTEPTSYFFSIFSLPKTKMDIKNFRERLYGFFQTEDDFLPLKYRMGKSRIDTIAVNVIIPLAHLYSIKTTSEDLKQATENIFSNYPRLPKNFILDFMSKFADSSQRKIINKKSLYQQGVLYLYYSFCNKHLCEICKINKKEILENMQ